MKLHPVLACAAAVGAAAGVVRPALADPQIYEYRVEHPLYGDIGTYTNIVDKSGDTANVETKLHVVVKLLGVVVHRQDAERRERWQHDRLTLFRGVTKTNGDPVEVDGVARGNSFVITTPAGTVAAPADVRPTNPWSPNMLDADVVMSTRSGKIFHAHLDRVKDEVVIAGGKPERLRRFDITTDKHQVVWLDEHNVAVAFRTEENGTPVDFVLTRYPSGAPQPWRGPESERPADDGPQQTASGDTP